MTTNQCFALWAIPYERPQPFACALLHSIDDINESAFITFGRRLQFHFNCPSVKMRSKDLTCSALVPRENLNYRSQGALGEAGAPDAGACHPLAGGA
jgi:hypothetical protein